MSFKLLIESLILLASFSLMRSDQVLVLEVSRYEEYVYIIEANITNDNFPLRIEFDQEIEDVRSIKHFHGSSYYSEAKSIVIEVLHRSILNKFSNLSEFTLYKVGMKRFAQDSFAECKNLTFISIENDLIEEIPVEVFKNCKNLKSLSFYSNKIRLIESGSFEGLEQLNYLNLGSNQLTSIHSNMFMQLPSLKNLFVSSNPIQEIKTNALPHQLEAFYAESIELKQLNPETFYNLTQLKELSMALNSIEELPPNIFYNLKSLEFIYMGSTNIRRLNKNSFGRMENLTNFLISDSKLDEIEPTFFDNFPALEFFSSYENLCFNGYLDQVYSIDFKTNPILNQCFAYYYIPREETKCENAEISGLMKTMMILGLVLAIIGGGILYIAIKKYWSKIPADH